MVNVKEDMTGWVMAEHGVPDSKLTVLEQTDDYITPNGNRYAQYLCKCNCEANSIFAARASEIKSGRIKTCGCNPYRNSVQRKHNKYDLSGYYGIGWTTNTNKEFYFDLEDYDKIKDYCWLENPYGYIVSSTIKPTPLMHRIVMNAVDGKIKVDHINHNRADNRKFNLRKVTQRENRRNTSISKSNTSGIIGVSWRKEINKWQAYIGINDKHLYLGSFANKQDAIRCRLEAEAKYGGKYAPQRHLFEEYDIKV